METFDISRALFGGFVGWGFGLGILAILEIKKNRAELMALKQEILDHSRG